MRTYDEDPARAIVIVKAMKLLKEQGVSTEGLTEQEILEKYELLSKIGRYRGLIN